VINRGEAATRFMNTARRLTNTQGEDYEIVALYTDPDRGAPFVRRADRSLYLGEPLWQDPNDPYERDENGDVRYQVVQGERTPVPKMKSQYVNHERLYQVIEESGADAVWLGWGFVAEDAAFVAGLETRGITVIGPSAHSMRLLGDKIESKKLAERVGVPVASWSGEAVPNIDAALRVAERLGYPVVIKATAGGGGRGIRFVNNEAELRANFESARSEARKAFGNDTVFIESAIPDARHIEVQILADQEGHVMAVGDRDCTLQRKNQKLIEMAPSPFLPGSVRQQMYEAAIRLAQEAHYTSVGTVEFLYNPATQEFFFMEMNTRLQVEHTITEEVTGMDLVEAMIDSATGVALASTATPPANGFAIQVRVNAEDPENGFAPAPGLIRRFQVASVPGVRTDHGILDGTTVTPYFDSNVAKVIGTGSTFSDAVATTTDGLRNTVIIGGEGLRTTAGFALELLENPDVLNGQTTTKWLERTYLPGRDLEAVKPDRDVALLTAATLYFHEEKGAMTDNVLSLYERGIPSSLPASYGTQVDFALFGQDYSLDVVEIAPHEFWVRANGAWAHLRVEWIAPGEYRVFYNGRTHIVSNSRQPTGFDVTVDGRLYPVARQEKGKILAPMPGAVLAVDVRQGDHVTAGQRVAVIEAMKMETALTAPESGTVIEVAVGTGNAVQTGQLLFKIEPDPAEPRYLRNVRGLGYRFDG